MFNDSWEGKDLGGFIKTTLAQQLQKSKLGQFANTFGISALLAPVTKKTSEDNALKIADGIDMGYQVPKNIIPIIYGHIGMSNTQFDDGQKPSDLDAEVIVQSVKMPISEGPIHGPAMVGSNSSITWETNDNSIYHLRHVILNDSYVIDPVTNVANYKDVKFEMTLGDGGTSSKKTATLEKTNSLLGVDIEAIDDTTNDTLLNDLGDVTAAKGVNNVLYWNAAAGRWEAKSFNDLLNEAGATYDGGAGGDGGDGGTGGPGGTGGTGGVGPADGLGLRYTQWNPPPTHTESTGTFKTTTTVTEPPTTGTSVISGKGAPLRVPEPSVASYFESSLTFDVTDTVDTISATMYFPDGIYKELTTVQTAIDGHITLCGTQRPNLESADSGDLDCLTPNVTVASDGQSSTTKTRTTGSVEVHLAYTTTICSREFILHEDFVTISHLKNGPYEYTHSVAMTSMNAGAGTKDDGTQQDGALAPSGLNQFPYTSASCNSTDVALFDFKDWTLSDYLTAYPDQILNASNVIKVYAWVVESVGQKEKTISTNTFLRGMSVCDAMDGYGGLYDTGVTAVTPFNQFAPDHGFNYKPPLPAETGVEAYSLGNKRCAESVVAGTWSTTKNPDPLLVWDYSSMGTPGVVGTTGASGGTGDSGASGTTGAVTVPTLAPLPFVTGKDGSYPGNGIATTVTLPTIDVTNNDASAVNTLTLTASSGTIGGTLNTVTVPSGITASGGNTKVLVLIGNIADMQTCLNSGITFASSTATKGDVGLTLNISTSAGSSLDNRTIRSAATTSYIAPTFTITVTDYSAGNSVFDGYVRGIAIMNSITNTTSNTSAATQIAGAINSYIGSPEWTATSSGAVVTVTGPVGLGASYNDIMPTQTGTMATTITAITGGVSPSRTSQPTRNAGNLKARFIPALAFSNTLTDTAVAFAQLAYRPPQGDGQTTLSEVGFMVGGRMIQYGSNGSFSAWKTAGYTGTLGWTNNPAWAFFDYFTNEVFGLGKDVASKLDDAQKEALYNDVWNFAIWCAQDQAGDDIIDCNAIIYGAESKIEVLQKIAALGNGKFVYLNGNPRLIYDGSSFAHAGYTPTVKKLVNQSNAGNLMYQSGSIDNLYNVINVKFANRLNYYRLEEVQYKNAASITKFGERETTIDFWGCAVKQQALWQGAWQYETEAANSEMVTYVSGWDHFDVLPGDLICLNDTLRPDNSVLGGRVISTGSGTVTLDRSASGSIAVMDTSGVVKYGTVSGTTATVSGTFQANAVWNIYTGTLAQNYRVVAIEESEDGIYAVTAQKHDPAKYTRVWANTI
jgi:hypothetical protein